MMPAAKPVGDTRRFVEAKGFVNAGPFIALAGSDNTRRLFAELNADPDRPDVRPEEAYTAILSSLQPGWVIRAEQVFWPDKTPRLTFRDQVRAWNVNGNEGKAVLRDSLLLSLDETNLPYIRRTILEFVATDQVSIAWWESLASICLPFGVQVKYLGGEDIKLLIRWILNPHLE
jgi:hypothetical protein